jgi:hypothetical protein
MTEKRRYHLSLLRFPSFFFINTPRPHAGEEGIKQENKEDSHPHKRK